MSLQHSEKPKLRNKEAIVSFRCRPEIKRALRVRAAEQETSVESVLDELLAPALGLPVASESSEQAGDGLNKRTA
jgi:plasmid stability protein